MVDERIDRKRDYLQGTTGGAASSPVAEEAVGMRRGLVGLAVATPLALVLGVVPFIGPFVAGFTGGFIAGTRVRGIYVGLVPAVASMIAPWLFSYSQEMPIVPVAAKEFIDSTLALTGGAGGALALAIVLMGAFLAAILGGFTGGFWRERRDHTDTLGRPVR